jgi:hypothetical protein
MPQTAAATENNGSGLMNIIQDIRDVATGTKGPTVNTEVGIEDDSIYKIAGALALVAFLAALFWGVARYLSK